jgi:hypothetical protein
VVQQSGSGSVQGKLVVGAPNDIYEQEAERVAQSITSTFVSSQHLNYGCLPVGSRDDAAIGETSASLGSAFGLQHQDVPDQTPDLGSLDIHVQNVKTNAPIAGANVHIDQAGVSGPKSIDLVTNRNGDTTSVYLEEGNYTVTVTFWCCDPQTFTMHVDGGGSNFVVVQMKNCECRIASQDGSQVPGDGGTEAAGGSADNIA